MKNPNTTAQTNDAAETEPLPVIEHGESKLFPQLKFLFVSEEADCGDLAWQMTKEGHEVKMFIANKDCNDIADGFNIQKVDRWESFQDWADVIVFDDCGFGEAADELRKNGKLVVGGGVYTDKLELDREFGQNELRKAGLPTLPHWEFDSIDKAIEFVEEHPLRYVFKPFGKIAMEWEAKSLLFLGQEEDGKDVLAILRHNKKNWEGKLESFQLQKYASGIEIAVSAFFNGHDFIYPININFEHKKLFPGDIGPYTGEMGTLTYWDMPNNFFKATLGKMKDRLAEHKYVGVIDINCIVNGKGIYPLEFTSRFGYPTISIMQEGVTSPWGEFFYALAKGEDYKLKTKRGFQIGVVVAIPPYPNYDPKSGDTHAGMSIIFKKPNPNLTGIHLGDVKMEDGDLKIAGNSGYVLVVTGSNHTVENARKEAYHRIDNIILQNMFYRTDIGEKWPKQSDELWAWDIL